MNDAGKPTHKIDISLISIAQLADFARQDAEFLQIGELYRNDAAFDVQKLVAEIVEAESVPLLPILRYKPSGLRKRAEWEHTWKLQRLEDAIDARTKLPKDHPDYLPEFSLKELKRQEFAAQFPSGAAATSLYHPSTPTVTFSNLTTGGCVANLMYLKNAGSASLTATPKMEQSQSPGLATINCNSPKLSAPTSSPLKKKLVDEMTRVCRPCLPVCSNCYPGLNSGTTILTLPTTWQWATTLKLSFKTKPAKWAKHLMRCDRGNPQLKLDDERLIIAANYKDRE